MYNNGLQDPELQQLHKKLKLNMNLFLEDILKSDLFLVQTKGEQDTYNIYPLFYCDRIETDGDAFIKDSYFISCKKDYEQIFLFISDNNIIVNKTYTLKNLSDNTYVIFIYDEWTYQPVRNTVFAIKHGEGNIKQYLTDNLGYCIFTEDNMNFEVIL